MFLRPPREPAKPVNVIEFYIPSQYKSQIKYTPLAMRGKIIEFKRKD